MSSQMDSSLSQPQPTPPLATGGTSLQPTQQPAASSQPRQDQQEASQALAKSDAASETANTLTDDDETLWRAAAMDLGRTSYIRHGGKPVQFEQAEDELVREWDTSQRSKDQRVSWQQARELARDAWDQARSALESGDAKPSAR